MVPHEAFRRVQQVHELGRPFINRPSRPNTGTRSGVSKTGGRESQQTWPETRIKEKAESIYAFRFRPRAFLNLLEGSFRFFILLCGKFRIRQPLPNNLLAQQTETIPVIHRIIARSPIVESKSLFIHITEEMKRLYRDVSSAEAALQQRPEILQPLRVYVSLYVTLKMVDYTVNKGVAQSAIPRELICRNRGTGQNVLTYNLLHLLASTLPDDVSLNFSTAFQYSHDGGLGCVHSKCCACVRAAPCAYSGPYRQ